MTHHILISDRYIRDVPDGALLAQLATEVERGVAAGGRTVLVAGHTLPRPYDLDPSPMLWALRHPRGRRVEHHADGWTRVVLTAGIEVDIYPEHKSRYVMTMLTPAEVQRRIDRRFVLTSLAEVHTVWGDEAWTNGDAREAIRHWAAAAQFSLDAQRKGGASR
jgi:hypothetical protein